MDIRKEAFENPTKKASDEYIEVCERDVIQTIEHIERTFHTVLIGDREMLPQLKKDVKGKSIGFVFHFISTWEAGMMERVMKRRGIL